MYAAFATALSSTPATTSPARAARADGAGTTARVASTARPITTTLLTVPRPGFCRRGIQASSTSAPTAMATVPSDQPS
jgi:hypothetical protein